MATLRNVLYRQLRHCSISPRGGSSISRLAGLGSYRVNLAAAACTVDSSSNTFLKPTTTTITHTQRRHYTPVTKDEEEQEKLRVATLTEFQKDQELRKYNRELAKLEFLKGINTGDLYTWSGKYKALARDYGFPLLAWYWAVWGTTCCMCYGAIHVGGVDAMAMLAQVDARTGFDLVSKVDPDVGKFGLAIVVNELAEPLRLPFVIVTVKPVMNQFFPPKY